jgi:hypothetical protein
LPNEFEVFQNPKTQKQIMKPQNPKQIMNIVDILSHTPKLKVIKTTWTFNMKLI